MNDKWFNYAITMTALLIFINAFITIGASQPDMNGNYNTLFKGENTEVDYSAQKEHSDFTVTPSTTPSSAAPTQEQGITYVKRASDNKNYNFFSFDFLVYMSVGFEIIMLQLASIFSVISPLFYAIAGFAFMVKSIVLLWLATIVARQLFTGRFF